MGKKGNSKGGAKPQPRKDIAQNRKALHEYEILDRYEAGIALTGTEVKGLRESGAMIREAYAQIINGEVFLVGAHISDYGPAGGRGHGRIRALRRAVVLRLPHEIVRGTFADRPGHAAGGEPHDAEIVDASRLRARPARRQAPGRQRDRSLHAVADDGEDDRCRVGRALPLPAIAAGNRAGGLSQSHS